jgi:hypothetical protein
LDVELALGAFLSGAGAVLSTIFSLRVVHRQEQRECEKRIEDMKRTLFEAVHLGRE